MTTVLVHLAVDYLGTDGMAGRFPGVRFVQVDPDGPVDPDVHGQVLVTRGVDSPNLTDVLDRGVEWVHCTGHGIDEIPLDAIGDRILTCARGATAVPIAEWVVAMLLTAEKRLPEVWVDAPPGRWYVTRLGGLVALVRIEGLELIPGVVQLRAVVRLRLLFPFLCVLILADVAPHGGALLGGPRLVGDVVSEVVPRSSGL